MSLELSPDRFEIRDDVTDGLVLNHATRLAPVVHKLSLSNVDLTFPDVSRATNATMSTGTTGSPTRGWRAYAWGLRINAGIQSGSINLGAVPVGLSPNFILAKFRAFRSVNPREDVFGPIIKSMLENTWITGRAGRLEFGSWVRRIFWIDVADGQVRLNWKQSTRTYNPNALDPNNVFFPDRYRTLERPPAYQLGSRYYTNEGGVLDPPINFPPDPMPESAWPSVNAGPAGAFSFASTWRFTNLDIWLGQV